ncbi:MAG: LamG domain-containing protein, partial [Candidatus Liptonbacteria bacterium]|nr:LamG domain-containing protein [Candidatus Liptonbacteria bacterium]
YSDEGVTATTSTLKLVVNGSSTYTTSTNANGTFSFNNVGMPSSTNAITIWMNNDGGGNGSGATVVTHGNTTGTISGLDIYKNYLIINYTTSTASTTNSAIAMCTKTLGTGCADADLHFDVSGSNLTVDADWGLYIWPGKTYFPNGTVTLTNGASAGATGGDIKFGSATSTFYADTNAVTVGGDWNNNAGGPFATSTSQLVTFSATTTGFTINTTGTQAFASTTFNGLGGGWRFATSTTINGNFTIATGTVTAPTSTLTIGGSFLNNGGTFTAATGTVKLTSTSTNALIKTNGSSFYNLEINNGLVGYWNFDEESGTIVGDSSGNGNVGTWNGTGNHFTTGKVGGAGQFNGSDDYVDVGNGASLSVTAGLTIAAWIKTSSSSEHIFLDNKAGGFNGYTLQQSGADPTKGAFSVANNSADKTITGTATIDNNVFNLVVGTFNSGVLGFSVNGQSDVPTTASFSAITALTKNTRLGSGALGGAFFIGSIDEVRVYNRALSASEILALASSTVPADGTYTLQDNLVATNDIGIRTGKLDVSSNNQLCQ